jgi:sarcosine oxidase, subunit gamma
MSDALNRAEPVPSAPMLGAGVTVTLAPPMARFSLRARTPEALESLLGVAVPRAIGAAEGQIACLGPDEYLLRADAGTKIASGAGLPFAITDISDRAVCFTVAGPGAAALLMTGCPLDLDRLAVGRAVRTLFETVEIIVIREADDRFQVEIWRSFAHWLWTALTTAARH